MNRCATLLKLVMFFDSTKVEFRKYTPLSSTPYIPSYPLHRPIDHCKDTDRRSFSGQIMVSALVHSQTHQLIVVYHDRPKLQIGRRASHLHPTPTDCWIPQCSYSNSDSHQEYCPACQIFDCRRIDQYHQRYRQAAYGCQSKRYVLSLTEGQ